MGSERTSIEHQGQMGPKFIFLERLTAALLLAVVLGLAWMIVAAYQPDWLRLASVETEVEVILTLLVAALGLVSLVALLHTRS